MSAETMRRIAKKENLGLRLNHRKLTEWKFRKPGGYIKANQFERVRKVPKRLKTWAGRVMRDVDLKMDDEAIDRNKGSMILLERILSQKRKTNNKIYRLHISEVECIEKGCYVILVLPGTKRRWIGNIVKMKGLADGGIFPSYATWLGSQTKA